MSTDPLLDAFAAEMVDLRRTGRLVRRTQASINSLSLDQAYAVQHRLIATRIEAGERPAGHKVGCTSRAVQEQFGLTQPVAARLMHPHVHASGVTLRAADYLGCAVEAELVLTLETSPDPDDLSDAALASCVSGASAGIEVHHYSFVHGPPTSQELIASNAIHGAVVRSPDVVPLAGLDLPMDGVGLWVDGRLAASALQAEILGSGPWESLRWLVRHLAGQGRRLEPGELVLPGSAVPLVRVEAGQLVTARFTSFGTCEANFA